MTAAAENGEPDSASIEGRIVSKIWWRIVPLVSAGFLFNVIDRINIAFAGLEMKGALALSDAAFGFCAGVYAIGMLVCGLPSTLLVERLGARVWMSIILAAWGLCSAATAFTHGFTELIIVRLLLGAAEAGFLPGAILYFSYWFPSARRGRVLSAFVFTQPVALILGGPICGALVAHGKFGLAGWQLMFLVEALPTLLLALAFYLFLPSTPNDALWLAPSERAWLERELARDGREDTADGAGRGNIRRTLGMPQVWIMAAAYFSFTAAGVGLIFFTPLVLRQMAFSILQTGFVASAPAIAGALVMPLWGLWADRIESREIVVASAAATLAVGLLATALLLPSRAAIVPLSFAMAGMFGVLSTFWTLPYRVLTRTTIAAGVGFINVTGNLGNLAGPYVLGWLTDKTAGYGGGLGGMAGAAALSAGLLMLHRWHHAARRKRPRSAVSA